MSIQIDSIQKNFGGAPVLKDISLTIGTGEMAALLGPSGSGKTTLLRIIAGLETETSGRILLDGADMTDVSARDRRVGFVFQNYALFRHMTAAENIAFGLTVRKGAEKLSKADIEARVRDLLAMVQLTDFAGRYPAQLSGGQQQRVALARVLAVEPQVLLLDEPFGALDAQVREDLRQWIRRLHEKLRFTGVFVTHDQEEAMQIADRVVVMKDGRIEQADAPEEIWTRPKTRFVLKFLCDVNVLQGRIEDGKLHLGSLILPLSGEKAAPGPVDVLLRPIDAQMKRTFGLGQLPIEVLASRPKGGAVQVLARPEGWYPEPINAILLEDALPTRGNTYYMSLDRAYFYRGNERLPIRIDHYAFS